MTVTVAMEHAHACLQAWVGVNWVQADGMAELIRA